VNFTLGKLKKKKKHYFKLPAKAYKLPSIHHYYYF